MTKACKEIICQELLEAAAQDPRVVVLCSDSRGSASLTPFAQRFPDQFVECGIAEQSLVSVAAGLARCGKRAFAASPACFLTTRSLEQCKVDVAYSNTNVKLIGISGGVSYGMLGLTHQSTQDIACMASIPNMRVYLPSDIWQTRFLMRQLLRDEQPAYIRVGRNPVPEIYDEKTVFTMDKAQVAREGGDVLLVACGETVWHALRAAEILEGEGISAAVLDLYSIKPLDGETLVRWAQKVRGVITVEEHVACGGLGAAVAQVLAQSCPRPMRCLSLPDAPTVAGDSQTVFAHYGLDAQGIAAAARELWKGAQA